MKVKFLVGQISFINLNSKIMKVKFFSIAAFFALLFATQLSATNPFDGTIVNFSTSDKTFTMSLRNVAAETVTIFLDDTEGVNLLTETVETKPNFAKNYRLENLPNGKYIFTVKRNGHKVVQPIDITSKGISISERERLETLLPTLVQKGDKVFVRSFVNKGEETTVHLTTNEGISLFKETYSDAILTKTFDVSKLPTGIYFFEVQTKGATEYFTVVK